MRLRNCRVKSDLDAKFVLTRYEGGDRYQVSDTNLCLQQVNRRAVKLRKCRDANPRQLFVGSQPDVGKFDLKPVNKNSTCLSQHHHPKAGEVIYAESCIKAHRPDTGYWVAY